MSRARYILFEIDAAIAIVCAAETKDRFIALAESICGLANGHANSAAAARALQHHRVLKPLRLCECILEAGEQTRSRQQRNAAGLSGCARCVLQGKGFNMFRSGSNKADAPRGTLTGELDILSQEAVAPMNSLCAR